MLNAQPQELATPRHAYQTAQYQVSKREMAALYKRYDRWVAARKRYGIGSGIGINGTQVVPAAFNGSARLTPPGSAASSTNSLAPQAGLRRAYHTASSSSYLVSAAHKRRTVPRHAYQAFFEPVSLPVQLNDSESILQIRKIGQLREIPGSAVHLSMS